jgi:hypothetical protein
MWALTPRLGPPHPLTKKMKIRLLRVLYIHPRWYLASILHVNGICEPERDQEVVQMEIYTVEVLSTVKTARLRSCRFPKGNSHIVLVHETDGCNEGYREIRSNLPLTGI